MLAYKGFHGDLTCTQGKGVFQYKPRVVYTNENSKCASTGFHCTEDPLECLKWYPLGQGNRYFQVEAGGSLDEDGKDAKIACTQIELLEELSVRALVFHAIVYMVKHPLRDWVKTGPMLEVQPERAEAKQAGAIAIARGENPRVCGAAGAVCGLVVERDGQITATKFFTVSGQGISGQGRANTWYVLDEKRQLKEVNAE